MTALPLVVSYALMANTQYNYKPDNSFFDNQFLENIDEFMSRYDGEIRLNTNTILDDILNAPISIDETKASLKYIKVIKAYRLNFTNILAIFLTNH